MTGNFNMMKKSYFILLLFFVSATFAADVAETVEAGTAASPIFELVRDWRVLSLLVVMISIVLIALAFAFGHGFEVPEIKAWASTEFTQAVVTVIIIISFIGVITLLDSLLSLIVDNSNLGFRCSDDSSQNCGITVADRYLSGMIDMALEKTREALRESAKSAAAAGKRFGGGATPLIFPLPLLQASFSASNTAGEIIHVERYNVVLEYYANLLSALYSQKFFVSQISYKLAPILLVLGILGRSFFMTRRLGGLLIAVGIGVLYIFPLMYVFNWITLNVTLFGDSIIAPEEGGCPQECRSGIPLYYYSSGLDTFPLYSETRLYTLLVGRDGTPSDSVLSDVESLTSGTLSSMAVSRDVFPDSSLPDGTILMSCEAQSRRTIGSEEIYCPPACRERPYPGAYGCGNTTVRRTCDQMPEICKIARLVSPATIAAESGEAGICPLACLMVPPLKNDCSVASPTCAFAPDFCRVTWADRMTARPESCSEFSIEEPEVSEFCSIQNCIPRSDRAAGTSCEEGSSGSCIAHLGGLSATPFCEYRGCTLTSSVGGTSPICEELAGNTCRLRMGTASTSSLCTLGGCVPREGVTDTICTTAIGGCIAYHVESDPARFCEFRPSPGSGRDPYCSEGGRRTGTDYLVSCELDDARTGCIAKRPITSGVDSFCERRIDVCLPNPDARSFIDAWRLSGSTLLCERTSPTICTAFISEPVGAASPVCTYTGCALRGSPVGGGITCEEAAGNTCNARVSDYARNYCTRGCSPNAGVSGVGCKTIDGGRCKANILCPASLDATESCVYVMPSRAVLDSTACDNCLFASKQYTYNPPVYTNCASLCNPSAGGPPKISPTEFATRTREGMFGRQEVKSVAAMMLPAYVLLLLNIVVTLMFIRTFSSMLGGDIEIPGIAKII